MVILKELDGQGYHAVIEDIPGQEMVTLTITGKYHAGSNQELIQFSTQAAVERGYNKCLVDYRGAIVTMSTAEIYNRPKEFKKAGVPWQLKSAMLFDPEKVDIDTEFVETVFYNRGWQLRCFLELTAALDWLSE